MFQGVVVVIQNFLDGGFAAAILQVGFVFGWRLLGYLDISLHLAVAVGVYLFSVCESQFPRRSLYHRVSSIVELDILNVGLVTTTGSIFFGAVFKGWSIASSTSLSMSFSAVTASDLGIVE